MGSASVVGYARWWEGKHFPDAGEVIGWRETRALRAGEDVSYPYVPVSPGQAAGSAAPARAVESNRERASRRARTRLRRYAVANRLRYLWVLTFAPDASGQQPTDLGTVKRAVASWVKRGLRDTHGYDRAYVVGFERHKSGAWHVNVLLSRRLDKHVVQAAWGRGNVWVSRFEGRRGESMRDGARRAAAYVAKYVSKEFGESGPGTHRYEVAQGFQVREVRVFALSATGLLEELERGGAGRVVYRFDAPAGEAGRGPPIVWAAFA